jgi:hypothetical protein
MVGEPLAMKQGQPEGSGIVNIAIYQLPDRFPKRFSVIQSFGKRGASHP